MFNYSVKLPTISKKKKIEILNLVELFSKFEKIKKNKCTITKLFVLGEIRLESSRLHNRSSTKISINLDINEFYKIKYN